MVRTFEEELEYLEKHKNYWIIKKGFVPNMKAFMI
jgi:hypothetical protein